MSQDAGMSSLTVDTVTAARLLGCSAACLRSLARNGSAPIEPLHLGRHLRWSVAHLQAVLGDGVADAVAAADVAAVAPAALRSIAATG